MSDEAAQQQLNEIRNDFAKVMQTKMEAMWAAKLGLDTFNAALFSELTTLMMQTHVDYTIFFRELSNMPDDIGSLQKSFYKGVSYEIDREGMNNVGQSGSHSGSHLSTVRRAPVMNSLSR